MALAAGQRLAASRAGGRGVGGALSSATAGGDRSAAQAIEALCKRAAAGLQRLAVQQHAEQEEELLLAVEQAVQAGAALGVDGEGVDDGGLQAGHQALRGNHFKEGWAQEAVATEREKTHCAPGCKRRVRAG